MDFIYDVATGWVTRKQQKEENKPPILTGGISCEIAIPQSELNNVVANNNYLLNA